MPSGPKKRRASKRKKGANGRFIDPTTGEEENHVELHESVSNEREMSLGDKKAGDTIDEMGSKESQSADIQTGFKEIVKESEEVPVLDKSEYVDRALLQAPLNEPISNNPEENGYGEVKSASQGPPVVMKEGEETSMESVLEERLEEPIERSSDEVQEPSKEGQDLSVSKTNAEASINDAQDSVVDMLPVEDVLQRNKFAEIGEREDHGPPTMVNEVVSIMKEGEEISVKSVLKNSLEKPTESSSHEIVIPMKETQDSLDESVIEVDVEAISFEDAPDSFETPLGSPSMSPVEADAHLINGYWNQPTQRSLPAKLISLSKVQDPSFPVKSVNEVDGQISSEDPQDYFKESGSSSVVDVSHVQENERAEVGENVCHDDSVLKEDGQMSMEGVLVEPFEGPIGRSLDELQAMVKMDDQSVLKGLHLKEAQDPLMNVDTSFDAQDSSNKPLVSPSLTELTFVSNNVHINDYGLDQIECSSNEPQAMYKTAELVTLKEIPLKVQDNSLAPDSVIEAHIETSFKDARDSLKRSLGDSSIDDVSSMYHGQPEMVNDVESTIKEDEGIPINGALEENFEEPNVGPLDEPQSMVKKVDQDPSIQADSVIEVNVDTSFKIPLGLISSLDDVFPVEGIVQENECSKVNESACHGPPTMVNHVESEIQEDDDEMSMEVVLEEPTERSLNEPKVVQDSFNDPLESSSLVNVSPIEGIVKLIKSTMMEDEELSIKTVDHSILNAIPSREAQDPSGPDNKSVIELNVASKDGSPVEGGGQRNGQRNDMVGLAKTLLEEIRRIRAFYEEGLRQTTEIHLHICRVLEKFDSGELS